MAKAMLGKIPLSRWQGLRDDLENKVAGPNGQRWLDDLSDFLRKIPEWQERRYKYGNDIWTLGRTRVFEKAGYGRWVNGIFIECRLVWFTNHLHFYALHEIFDAKTFEFFEWSEATWPAWDTDTFKGFCTAVGSQHFFDTLCGPKSDHVHVYYTADGQPCGSGTNARFHFSGFGPGRIQFELPEVQNAVILEKELFKSVHMTLNGSMGKNQLERFVS